jgi:hypothetical protein
VLRAPSHTESRCYLSGLGSNAKHTQQTQGRIIMYMEHAQPRLKARERSNCCEDSTIHGGESHVAAISTRQRPLSPHPTESNQTAALSSNRVENDVHRLRTVANAMVDVCFKTTTKRKLHFFSGPGVKHFPCQRKSVAISSPGRPL